MKRFDDDAEGSTEDGLILDAADESRLPVGPGLAAFPVVGVGASAGGLDAFTQLLKHLPADTGMAFVLIQHLDPTHASFLRDALAKATTMTVSQAEDGTAVEPNHVYVIPPDADISLNRGRLTLASRALDGRRSLSVDGFLRSLAADRGSHAIGVVLSGNASDGTEGLRAIKAESGITLAQAPESAKYGEMPRNAVSAGVVDAALPIPELARELVRLSRHPYVAAIQSPSPPGDAEIRNQILMVMRNAFGVDFGEYKPSTVERRLARRMALRRAPDVRAYLALAQGDPEEIRALYEDILIHVTSFFRDPAVFQALESQLLPAILKDKPEGAPVRIWVAGCSTGEEVYGIAISLLEVLGSSSRPIQIFGSDLSEPIIARARAGLFSDASLRDVSDERRRRYFAKTDRGYRINKTVRDLCVFVQHDLARDPPFSKLDLVSCRNVLIYFDQALQKRIIPSFHYALNQPGYLLLGHTESISGFASLFSAVDKANKIFARTALASTLRFAPRFDPRRPERPVSDPDTRLQISGKVDVAKHLDRLLLARYAPPGVLINQRMEILQFRGQTGSFLQPAPGDPQSDVIKMARPGLISVLRTAVAQAKKDQAPVRRNGVEVDQDGFTRKCNLVVLPFTGYPEMPEPLFVVLFEEAIAPAGEGLRPSEATSGVHRSAEPSAEDRRLPRLEHELVATKEYLQSLIEEHGRTNDDLGTANEELVSGNEELQSMNEELETAKEELQSTNEELTTVNDELQSRNQEVTQVNSDLLNLLATVDIPIVILDRERRIRRFTPKARSILNVVPADLGRPLDDIRANVGVPDLDRQVAEVIDTMAVTESEVQDRDGRWYRMQIRPYKNTDNKIDGAILSLVDIDALKHLVTDSQQARSEAENANRAKDLFLAVLGHELRTPLASLLLQAQLLRRGKVVDAAKLGRVGEVIERATRMQMQLVDDLLDVSRIVAGKLKVELGVVELSAVIKAALEGVSGPVQRKSLELDVVLDRSVGAVAGDAARLQQVVSNLLTNAIKFSSEGGHVTVTLEKADGCARIKVSDTGAGIEPGFLPHVFDRFSQADTSNTRMYGGLGLGLAIVRHLVEQHGGMIQADSPGSGKGATFSVTLPLMNVQRAAANGGGIVVSAGVKRGPRDHHRIKDLRVLIVDDDVATQEALSEVLREMGAEVKVAQSAAEAMTAVVEFHPQLLLCDIAMPGEDGYAFIRRLRARGVDGSGSIPALALTALATDDDHQRSLAAGFQMHLTKPVDIERLSQAVIELAPPPHAS
jgi:chemotaxis methyl-accepting protein methylase/signal transduction histidine kinase/chemotaxis response regulator CheB